MQEPKNYLVPNAQEILSNLVKIGLSSPEGKKQVQQFYTNPPPWMTPSEAKLYVPLAAERLDRIAKEIEKIAAPTTTVVEDKLAGLAGLNAQQPQGQAPQQEQQQEQQPEAQPQGGVADLPVSDDMYQEQSMAGGGIVAFDGGGEVQRFANQGLVAINIPQLRDNYRFLVQQYNALPDGSPEKAQIAEIIQQIDSKLNPSTPEGITAVQPKVPVAPPKANPLAGALSKSNAEIELYKKAIANLKNRTELTPKEISDLSSVYMKERGEAGAEFKGKAEALIAKQQARVNEIGKDSDLRAALKFFAELAASPTQSFGANIGRAGNAALSYYDTAEEKKQAAQAAYDSMQVNYNMARAAEARGDLDSRDKYLRDVRDDRRQATTAEAQLLNSQGMLAAKQMEGIINLSKLDTERLRAQADLIRANAPPDAVQTFKYIEDKIRGLNKQGLYSKINGGKPLSDEQIFDAANSYVVSWHNRGGGDTYKGTSIDTALMNATETALTNNSEYIAARTKASDTKASKEERDAATKRMEEIRADEFNKRRGLYKKDFIEGQPKRDRSILGDGEGSLTANFRFDPVTGKTVPLQ